MARVLSHEAARLREAIDRAELTEVQVQAARRAILARVERPRRQPWVWLPVPAVAAAAAVLVVALWPARGWYEVVSGEACLMAVAGGGEVRVAPDCAESVALTLDADSVLLAAGSRLTRDLRLRRGRATFEIRRRAAGEAPRVILVSHGRIDVLGTRFVVEQHGDSGSVRLLRGRVAFHWNDGAPATQLAPGDILRWPRPAADRTEAPERKQPEPRRKRAHKNAPATDREPEPVEPEQNLVEVMRRLSQLRSQRRYADARRLLADASARADLGVQQRERLSFELGNIIGLAGDDPCPHWRAHAAAFPTGPRAPEVRRKLEACGPAKP